MRKLNSHSKGRHEHGSHCHFHQEYYSCLQGVRDEGDWERRLAVFRQGVFQGQPTGNGDGRRILALREHHRQLIGEGLRRAVANGHRVLVALFERPIVSTNDVRERTRTSYQSANILVGEFLDLDVLQEMTSQRRSRRFICWHCIVLFHDEPGAAE